MCDTFLERTALWKTFGPKKEEVSKQFMILDLYNEYIEHLYRYPSIVRLLNEGDKDGLGMWLAWGKKNV
jgi:hypothetical protein